MGATESPEMGGGSYLGLASQFLGVTVETSCKEGKQGLSLFIAAVITCYNLQRETRV